MSLMAGQTPVPMTLITGFLGSGKTTLVNHLLAETAEQRDIAVIVNDFGKVSVDSGLIRHRDENMLTLSNGCVCCSLAGDLAAGLIKLLTRGSFSHCIMESSGVTRVTPLRCILDEPELRKLVRLESVVVMVDPVRYPRLSQIVMTLEEQVQHADVLVINRCDLATPDQLQETENLLGKSNAGARMIRTEFGRANSDELRGGSTKKPSATHVTNLPGDKWSAYRLYFNRPFAKDELRDLLGSIPGRVMRVKGWLKDPSGEVVHVEQVHDEISVESWKEPLNRQPCDCLIMIIPTTDADEFERDLTSHPEIIWELDHSHTHHIPDPD